MTDPIQWLTTSRKLDDALLTHMGVKAVDHPGLGRAVAFPYRRNGEPYAAKFRTVEKGWRSTKDVTRGLYNADVMGDYRDQPIVITEGEIDCLSVIQAGFERAVSLPDGWTEQGNKTECLVSAEDALAAAPFIIVAGDNDTAGESLPRVVANLLPTQDVRFAEWSEGCKDANDVLMAFGEGEVAACLNRAKRIDPPGGFITAFSDLPPMSRRRVLKGGVDLIDYRLAFELGAMSVGTGTPGAGKSTFSTWVAYNVARHERVRVGFLSFETHAHRTRDHLSRLLMGLPFDRLAGPQRDEALRFMDDWFRVVHRTFEDGTTHALGWLKSMIHTLAARENCKLIIVDPWNELEHLPEPGESMTNYINFALQQIRQWAEKLEVHICVIAHPKKMDYARDPRPPLGYDIADSAAFFNKPSLGWTIHNRKTEAGAPFLELWTWKVRDAQLYGIEKGRSEATFDKDRMTYTKIDLEEGEAA